MISSRYRLTASNIEIVKKQTAKAQTIKLISYAYFQSNSKKYSKNTNKLASRKKPKKFVVENEKTPDPNQVNVASVVDKNVTKVDSLSGVPEMWLEPATEPIEDLEEDKEKQLSRPRTLLIKQNQDSQEKPLIAVEPKREPKENPKEQPKKRTKREPDLNIEEDNNFHDVVVLGRLPVKK